MTAKQWLYFNRGAQLILEFVHKAVVPECFKRRAARNTRESSRGDAVLGLPDDKYDYYEGKYEAEKSAAEVTKYDSDNLKDEYSSDKEDESDDQEPLKNLLVLRRPLLVLFKKGLQLSRFSYLQTAQPPESVSDDADDEFDDSESAESLDSFWEGSGSGSPKSLEASSKYIDEKTDSEIGTRDSPLRLRSRTHRSRTQTISDVNLLNDRFRLL
ncbi:hypothetical protein C0993_005390 [Termitomyces sp. T159_Od127]|nr:hypothetical protein C0993_005390 [Termitomyces sp. T159_Od127]